MSDLPLQNLLDQLRARTVPGEHLEILGKQAAASWCEGRFATLTEAVTATVKTASLAPEQVRRVVEFANTDAFSREFRKEGAHRVVSFSGGPADAGVILRDLNDGGGGSVHDRGLSDYSTPPKEKTASSEDEERAFAELFGTEPPPFPMDNPFGDLIDVRDKLATIHDHLSAEISSLEVTFGELSDRVYDHAKQASLSGISLGDVMHAWQAVAPSMDHLKIAFATLAPRLLQEGVFSSLNQMNNSVDTKTAGARVVRRNHPLVSDFGDYCEALSKLSEARATRDGVREQLGQANLFLKQAAQKHGAEGLIPEAWSKYKGVVEGIGQGAGHVAEALWKGTGGGTNKAVNAVGKYVLPAAVAKGVYDRHVAPNPLFQRAADAILPGTPGSMQYYGY
jgi:hypothetical protein